MMKFSKKLVISLTAILVAACAPRDTTHYLSINDALNSPKAKEILNPKIKLYFGKSVKGNVLAEGLVSNRKTNASNKADEDSCQIAFLSAVRQFQDRAESKRATKVSNIVSFYKRKTYSSTTQYECHAGHSISGVALKGDLVK